MTVAERLLIDIREISPMTSLLSTVRINGPWLTGTDGASHPRESKSCRSAKDRPKGSGLVIKDLIQRFMI
jgi:hypothetical protein